MFTLQCWAFLKCQCFVDELSFLPMCQLLPSVLLCVVSFFLSCFFFLDYSLLQFLLTSILLRGVFLSDLIFNQCSWTSWNQRSGFVNSLLLLDMNNCQCLPKFLFQIHICMLPCIWTHFIQGTEYFLQRYSLIESPSSSSTHKVFSLSISLWQALLYAQICF